MPADAPAGYDIRPATRRDQDLLAEMFRGFLEEQSDWGGMFGVESGAHPEYTAMFARLLESQAGDGGVILVAETQVESAPDSGFASPVGFLMATVASRPAFFHESSRGRIEDAWVRPEHRRSGIGRALVEAAVAWARQQGAARMILQVARRNEAGLAFWREMGFETFMDVMERDL